MDIMSRAHEWAVWFCFFYLFIILPMYLLSAHQDRKDRRAAELYNKRRREYIDDINRLGYLMTIHDGIRRTVNELPSRCDGSRPLRKVCGVFSGNKVAEKIIE